MVHFWWVVETLNLEILNPDASARNPKPYALKHGFALPVLTIPSPVRVKLGALEIRPPRILTSEFH